MRCRNKCVWIIGLLLLLCCSSLGAQEADTTVPEEEETTEAAAVPYQTAEPLASHWDSLTRQPAFSYKDKKEYIVKPQKPKEDPFIIRLLLGIIGFFASTLGHLMLWGSLLLIAGFLIYRLVRGEGKRLFGNKGESFAEEETTVIDEDDLEHSNWEERFTQALQSGDKRKAIRYSYMQLLQLLQHRDLIRYRQDKTNTAYYRELSGHEAAYPFRVLSRQYEYAWYGNYLPTQAAFDAYLQTFNTLKNKLL